MMSTGGEEITNNGARTDTISRDLLFVPNRETTASACACERLRPSKRAISSNSATFITPSPSWSTLSNASCRSAPAQTNRSFQRPLPSEPLLPGFSPGYCFPLWGRVAQIFFRPDVLPSSSQQCQSNKETQSTKDGVHEPWLKVNWIPPQLCSQPNGAHHGDSRWGPGAVQEQRYGGEFFLYAATTELPANL